MALDVSNRPLPAGVSSPETPLGLWGSYRAARRNVLELIPAAAYREPVIADTKRGRWIMLMDPTGIECVLRHREQDYPKSAILKRLMTPREGDNLIITEGDVWKRQRQALSTPFRPRALNVAAPIINDAARRITQALGSTSVSVDVFPFMTEASCDVMVDLALGGRDAIDRDALARSVDAYVSGLGRISLFDILGVPNWVPRPAALFDQSRKMMDDLADEIIAKRAARGPSPEPDLLDLLIEAHSEGTLDALEVRNNLLGFLFAGHETTALTLTWALYLLALHPEIQAAAREECLAVFGQDDPGMESLAQLKLVRQIIDETLRLYPPAGFLTRTVRKDDTLSGVEVKRGATVILPVYALHRHERWWKDPLYFDPTRFDPQPSDKHPRGAYLPFGDGPRICIGTSMAITEAVLILATLVRSLHFSLPEGRSPKPVMWFTLRPEGGLHLDVAQAASGQSRVSVMPKRA